MKILKKEKSKKNKWYKTWWFIVLIVIGFIFIVSVLLNTFTDNIQVGLINIDTSNSDFESENLNVESLLTFADCPKTYSDCNGTIKVTHSFILKNNKCEDNLS